MRKFATWLAMLGPTGLVPGPRATYGSAVITVIGWYLWQFAPVDPLRSAPLWLALFAAGTAISVWAAGEAEHVLGHDANAISIDEAVGMTLSLLFVPHTIVAYVTAFVLFRVLDVLKPLGADKLQALPGGWGVVADDFLAGIYSCAAFHLLRIALAHLGHPLLG